MKLTWARAARSHPALSGVSRAHFGELFAEPAPRGRPRGSPDFAKPEVGNAAGRPAPGASRSWSPATGCFLPWCTCAITCPHEVLAELYGVDRSTVSTAIRQVRPLLAARGFTVPDPPGVRLRTLEDLFAHAEAEDVELRLDGAETQARRPRAGRPGRGVDPPGIGSRRAAPARRDPDARPWWPSRRAWASREDRRRQVDGVSGMRPSATSR